MKIKYALVGSTNNPHFLDFWPIISNVWKKRFEVTPVLGLITDEETSVNTTNEGIVVRIKKSNLISDVIQSQLVRLYLPKFLDGICIISDIDMIPISRKYFIEDLLPYNEKDFLIMSSHHEQTIGSNQYPMCYIVGHSSIYKDIFTLNLGWESFISNIPNNGWFTDQVFLYNSIQNFKYDNFKFPYREFGSNIKRIDRADWSYNPELLNNDYYIDSHLLRPYNDYKYEIDKLINLL